MSEGSATSAYPTVASKISRRLRDIPWRLSRVRDALLPGEFARLCRLVGPYSMCSYARLRGLHRAVRYALAHDVAGDVVECGVARGGSLAMLGLTLRQLRAERTLWGFDTFEGLPAPTAEDPDYATAKQYTGTCRGELSEVERLLTRFDLLDRCKLVKGLFQDTVPGCGISAIAVLHLDGDWYESLKVCLEHLYDRVSPGGVIQIDDYGHWAGARKAVEEFLSRRYIRARLRYVDATGRQLIKPT
jgi:hypothetical protein